MITAFNAMRALPKEGSLFVDSIPVLQTGITFGRVITNPNTGKTFARGRDRELNPYTFKVSSKIPAGTNLDTDNFQVCKFADDTWVVCPVGTPSATTEPTEAEEVAE